MYNYAKFRLFRPWAAGAKIYIFFVYSYIGVKRKKTQNRFLNRLWVLVFRSEIRRGFPKGDCQGRIGEHLAPS